MFEMFTLNYASQAQAIRNDLTILEGKVRESGITSPKYGNECRRLQEWVNLACQDAYNLDQEIRHARARRVYAEQERQMQMRLALLKGEVGFNREQFKNHCILMSSPPRESTIFSSPSADSIPEIPLRKPKVVRRQVRNENQWQQQPVYTQPTQSQQYGGYSQTQPTLSQQYRANQQQYGANQQQYGRYSQQNRVSSQQIERNAQQYGGGRKSSSQQIFGTGFFNDVLGNNATASSGTKRFQANNNDWFSGRFML